MDQMEQKKTNYRRVGVEETLGRAKTCLSVRDRERGEIKIGA